MYAIRSYYVASARVIEEYQTSTPTNFDQETGEVKEGYPLGLAKAQLHKTYIVAQTDDGLVIVDQHAAHERLVYEKMKNNLEQGSVKSQMLLLPEIIEVEDSIADKMADKAEDFAVITSYSIHYTKLYEKDLLNRHQQYHFVYKESQLFFPVL